MPTSQPESIDAPKVELLRVLDIYGDFAYWADDAERTRLVRAGFARAKGTRRRVHLLQLIVPLAVAAGERMVRRHVILSPQRDRYHFRDREVAIGWKLKHIPTDQRGLFRPLTPRDAYQRPERRARRSQKSPRRGF
jgi:hypothetical protein